MPTSRKKPRSQQGSERRKGPQKPVVKQAKNSKSKQQKVKPTMQISSSKKAEAKAKTTSQPETRSLRKEVGSLKSFLLLQKSNLLNKSYELNPESLATAQDGVQDEADIASRQLSLNLSLNLHDRDRQALMQIERALGKINNGTYGLCESCGCEIGVRRLQARPFASLCIDCMHDQEEVALAPPKSPSNTPLL